LYSSFVRTTQSFVCFAATAEPEGHAGGQHHPEASPEEKIDLSAAPEPEKAPEEGGIAAHTARGVVPDSGASTHPVG